jgi:hypothetical protein
MAQLVVTAAVPGAEVVINGKRVGATPLPASVAVPPGKTSVELQRARYVTSSQTIALDEGARGELQFTLEEDPAAPASVKGRLVLSSSEAGSEVSVDGGPRRALAGPISLPVGPHHVRVEKAGFVVAERYIEVINGQDASLSVRLAPTSETAAQLDDARATRRTIGWTMAIGGLALVAGGVVYGFLANSAVSSTQKDLDTVLANQMQQLDPKTGLQNACFVAPGTMPDLGGMYGAAGCNNILSNAQNKVNTAKIERIVGFGVAGLGAVAAGVGFALVSGNGKAEPGAGVTTATVWGDGRDAAGVSLGGRF